MENAENKKKKSNTLKILVWVELAVILILAFLYFTTKSSIDTVVIEKEKTEQMNAELEADYDSIMTEYNRIKEEYGYLTDQLSEQDSLIIAQAEEIQQLINSQADYRRIKKKLDYLREITQGYVNQIDSLYRVNQELVAENQGLRTDLESANENANSLTEEKDNLNKQINDAAYLRAYSISATPYKTRSGGKLSETDKAKKVDMIRVCMVVGENKLVSSGQKDIYVRIARPDNLILTQGSYSFIYQGNRIQYSAKKVISYNQKAQSICIDFYRENLELPKGTYHIAVLSSEYEMGNAVLVLR
ncbi:MAG: hypothetical protein C0592_03665 [Marinilabiliales bacterium]|nr:MAG: hypothetical protein C0592_03665 [Marinilabiliales bacterium]